MKSHAELAAEGNKIFRGMQYVRHKAKLPADIAKTGTCGKRLLEGDCHQRVYRSSSSCAKCAPALYDVRSDSTDVARGTCHLTLVRASLPMRAHGCILRRKLAMRVSELRRCLRMRQRITVLLCLYDAGEDVER